MVYSAYDLRVHSSLPFPELPETQSNTPDVDIRLGKIAKPLSNTLIKDPSLDINFQVNSDGVYLFDEKAGAIHIRNGNEIIIDPVSGADERILRLYILGTAMGILLQQRGHLVLHASAVAAEGGAVAFIGESGFGKSTLAAMLHDRGLAVVTDDVLAVSVKGENVSVFPSFPRLKLWEDTAAALRYDRSTLIQLHPEHEKFNVPVKQEFPQAPLPLKRIYVLAEGKEQKIEPLTVNQVLPELIRHSYRMQFLAPDRRSDYFLHCAEAAKKVPASRLIVNYSFSEIPDLIKLVEEDISAGDKSLSLA
jgi:hypothetical protein